MLALLEHLIGGRNPVRSLSNLPNSDTLEYLCFASRLSISPLKLGSAKRVPPHKGQADSFEDSMDVDSDLERRKKQARKATLEFLKSSKERAKKSEEEKKVKSSSRKPERPSREVVQDNFILSDGLTEAEEDTQFVRSFFSTTLAHFG